MDSLARRDRRSEWMDEPGLDAALHLEALAGLRRINWLTSSVQHIWRSLEEISQRHHSGGPLRVLDVATGGGDVLIRLAQRAGRSKHKMQFFGCDISSTAVAAAQDAARMQRVCSVDFFQHDALAAEFPAKYDVVMCSLFLHHLPEAEAEALLRRMANAAERAVLVDDLLRTRLGYLLAWFGCRLITRSPVVHQDGPLSVRGAFTWEEAQALVGRAELREARFVRHWPQRFFMQWSRR
jgi:SAM-dependent methyltransferase